MDGKSMGVEIIKNEAEDIKPIQNVRRQKPITLTISTVDKPCEEYNLKRTAPPGKNRHTNIIAEDVTQKRGKCQFPVG
jgi:hypothetical protein